MGHPLRGTFVGDSIVRLADEGVPFRALSRTFKVPFESVHQLVSMAVEDGTLARMPAADWPAGASSRLPTAAPIRSETIALQPGGADGVICPCCGTLTTILSANLLARSYHLPPQQEAILTRIWQGKGKPVTGEACIAAMYADDLDGGPEYETARKYFKTQLCLLRGAIAGSGVRIEAVGYQRGYRLVLASGADFPANETDLDEDDATEIETDAVLVIDHAAPDDTVVEPKATVQPVPKARKKRAARRPKPVEESATKPVVQIKPAVEAKRTQKRSSLRQRLAPRRRRTSRFEDWK